ncbi:Putative uncharacterized protein [Lactococcus lactis subsp. lactis A12]
MMISY